MFLFRIITQLFLLTTLVASLASATSFKQKKSSTFEQFHNLTLGRYFQQPKDDDPADETIDLEFNSHYVFENFKITSYFFYSHDLTDKTYSDFDDPMFTITTFPKNFVNAATIRYYVVSTLGLSKSAKDIQGQYGTLGVGIGLALDSDYLKMPNFSLTGYTSISKGFQKTDRNTEGYSNNNYYMTYNAVASYDYKDWSFTLLTRFQQYFKYVSDESTEMYLLTQDIGYLITPNQELGWGHTNRMPLYDEDSGEVNAKLVNPESSYFYFRYTVYF